MTVRRKFPEWLKKPLPKNSEAIRTADTLDSHRLSTVCRSAKCPNLTECFSHRVATFMIMGDVCTRNCAFCGVSKGIPHALDADEPARAAEAAKKLGLKHVVVTSVTRDDISDGGASHFSATIRELRKSLPDSTVEVLVPDFHGDENALRVVLDAAPDIFNHNIETVPRLYPVVRPQADYRRSLGILKYAKKTMPQIRTKSGLMLGLGETDKEVVQVMQDLRIADCDMLTMGQYLQPGKGNFPVADFVLPTRFHEYELLARSMGFHSAFCAPFVRSSYHAADFVETERSNKNGKKTFAF